MDLIMPGTIAEAVVEQVVRTVLLKIRPKLWLLYVDKMFFVIKRSEVRPTLRCLHGYQVHPEDRTW